jgi:hypothetical protein
MYKLDDRITEINVYRKVPHCMWEKLPHSQLHSYYRKSYSMPSKGLQGKMSFMLPISGDTVAAISQKAK